MLRFFVFNYIGYLDKDLVHGEIFMKSEVFQSSTIITSRIHQYVQPAPTDITITGRFEFKDEADYMSHQYY